MTRQKTGMEELRQIVKGLDNCNESFLDPFSVDELVKLHRAWIACGWDFSPDTWTRAQVTAALAGTAPQWDANEKPVEVPVATRTHRAAKKTPAGMQYIGEWTTEAEAIEKATELNHGMRGVGVTLGTVHKSSDGQLVFRSL